MQSCTEVKLVKLVLTRQKWVTILKNKILYYVTSFHESLTDTVQ